MPDGLNNISSNRLCRWDLFKFDKCNSISEKMQDSDIAWED